MNTIAYSLINGTHTACADCNYLNQAELQQIEFRFAVPDSLSNAVYRITWDVITWDVTLGQVAYMPGSTYVSGTGNPITRPAAPRSQTRPPSGTKRCAIAMARSSPGLTTSEFGSSRPVPGRIAHRGRALFSPIAAAGSGAASSAQCGGLSWAGLRAGFGFRSLDQRLPGR